eukprot:gnl/MRDRNA2_/MRDRNA2_283742_c0_seq1.p1 gnl/MRDRNA2_/MRDRNA2_283742_c0~~gnl/MRDRNA2_/MRDRNA2_283742_c0_seq1.p1  ORF type:complete len:259 (+),score=45.75 gnl/MRDRNA2_/MRDRNA2_283742_c0_seq1:1-777(+)
MMVFAFLGTWSFGMQKNEYGSWDRSLYQLFRMFNGDALFGEENQVDNILYLVYLMIFVCLVFITLLNFLLAIIVNAYTEVGNLVKENQSEQDVVSDLWDSVKGMVLSYRNNWPSPAMVEEYLLKRDQPDPHHEPVPDSMFDKLEQMAVTAEELYENIVYQDKNEVIRNQFSSLKSAAMYVTYYAKKLKEDGELVLVESRDQKIQAETNMTESNLNKAIDDLADTVLFARSEGGVETEDVLLKIKSRMMEKNQLMTMEK